MRISEINIYPIKSLKGISMTEAEVEDRGFEHDRRWMLVDENNKFITQREFPVMARIDVSIGIEGLGITFEGDRIFVPAVPPANGKPKRVTVWDSSVKSEFYPEDIYKWFSEILGIKCRLAAMTEISDRKVSPFYAVRKFKDVVSFADGYPYLLIGQGSLMDLNARLVQPVPMNRFRPSLVVEGSDPFAEDTWKRIRVGSTEFHIVKPCGRCVMTTIDQSRGEKTGTEPLKTLASYRTKRGKVLFGQNLIAEAPGGTVRVGDEIEVLEFKKAGVRVGAVPDQQRTELP